MENLVAQEQFLGNRCGHRPDEPRWYERPAANKRTYDIIHLAQASLKYFYFAPYDYLLELHNGTRLSPRTIRSEGREAIMALGQVIVDHLDIASREVIWFKRPIKKGNTPAEIKEYVESLAQPKIPMTTKMLAKKAGISVSRCEHAIRALKRAGYLEVETKCIINKDTGEITPKPAIKRVSLTFFLHLGITLEKYRSCVREAQRREKSRSKHDLMRQREAKAALEQLQEQFQGLSNRRFKLRDKTPKLISNSLAHTKAQPESKPEWSKEKRLHYAKLLKFIKRQMPTAPLSEIHKLALVQIRNWKN